LHLHVGHPLSSKTLPKGQNIAQTGPHISSFNGKAETIFKIKMMIETTEITLKACRNSLTDVH